MDKYALLILLNMPFVIFGYIKCITMYKAGAIRRVGLLLRLTFWTVILLGLVFAREIYNFLNINKLTDTAPLSLAEVVLTTGVIFSLFLCMRIYAKVETLEKRFSDLQEKISIILSPPKN